jgi:hypothetical protein
VRRDKKTDRGLKISNSKARVGSIPTGHMSDCKKKPYQTKREARDKKNWLRSHHIDARFYRCPHCRNWHITTTKLNLNKSFENIDRQYQFRQAVQTGKAQFLRRLSKMRTVWSIILEGRGFVVTYNKRHKDFVIISYFSPPKEANDN